MKMFVLMMTLAFSSLSFAAVDSKAISAAYTKLSKIGFASEVYKVKPGSPYSMIKQVAAKDGDDEFSFEHDTTPEPDTGIWGTLSMKNVMGWIRSSEALTPAKADKGIEAIRSLIGSGVIFGMHPRGAVQCGIALPGLLLIDTETGKVYSVSLDPSGPC